MTETVKWKVKFLDTTNKLSNEQLLVYFIEDVSILNDYGGGFTREAEWVYNIVKQLLYERFNININDDKFKEILYEG